VSAPVTKEISDWLEKLGLPEYADRFSENKIDVLVLRHLTDQDLKDIGVPLGHRRKMLAAIANLDNTTAAAVPPPVSRSAPPVEAAATTAVGERRYLTVMFCDLVGSTGIAAKLNAEEWRDLVGADLDTASVAVVEMGGKVAKKLGDGLMALFGYPVAQENDAERAALAIHWPCCYSERAGRRKLAALSRPRLPVGMGHAGGSVMEIL
jgi:class 3 adenylate cyclase